MHVLIDDDIYLNVVLNHGSSVWHVKKSVICKVKTEKVSFNFMSEIGSQHCMRLIWLSRESDNSTCQMQVHFSSSITLCRLPMCGRISTTNSSPPWSVSFGFRAQPMPDGVPVILNTLARKPSMNAPPTRHGLNSHDSSRWQSRALRAPADQFRYIENQIACLSSALNQSHLPRQLLTRGHSPERPFHSTSPSS